MNAINVDILREYFIVIDSDGDAFVYKELTMDHLEEEGVIIQVLFDPDSHYTTSKVIAK